MNSQNVIGFRHPRLKGSTMPSLRTRTATLLQTKVGEYAAATLEIKRLEGVKKALGDELLAMADDAGGAVETETVKVSPVDGKSQDRISRELLVKFGVKASIIRKATIPGTPYRYPRITDKTAKPVKLKKERP